MSSKVPIGQATRFVHILTGALLSAVVILAIGRAQAQEPPPTEPPPDTVIASELLAVTKVISYQGRLVDPSSQVAKPDGNYPMAFRLYTAASGGLPVWTENQTVPVAKGAFTALLGSVTPFSMAIFNGQDLFLGVTVGGDPEMSPRLRMGWVAYAFYADNADKLDNRDSATFANATHNHAGSAINSGTVAQGFIDGAIARDAEIMPVVLANDGPGSGVNADLLDGVDYTSFAKTYVAFTISNQTLSSGQSVTYSTFGYPMEYPVLWWVRPLTARVAGSPTLDPRFRLEVDVLQELISGSPKITYFLRVTNVGNVGGSFDIVGTQFYQ